MLNNIIHWWQENFQLLTVKSCLLIFQISGSVSSLVDRWRIMIFIFNSCLQLILNAKSCTIITKFKKYYLAFIFNCCLFTPVYSQLKISDNLTLQTDYHFGAIIPEYKFVTYLVNDYVRSVEVSIAKETTGKNYWQQLYHYPTYGLTLSISTLGNDEVFGKQIALSPFYQIHLLEKKNLSLRVYLLCLL